MFDELSITATSDVENKCVVRLKTTFWIDKRCIHQHRSIEFLKRKSIGFNVLQEDVSQIGADEVVQRIMNFNSVPDGVYEVVLCNKSYDRETGHLDDYAYTLIPV